MTKGCAPYPAHFRSGYEAGIPPFLYSLAKSGFGLRLRFSSHPIPQPGTDLRIRLLFSSHSLPRYPVTIMTTEYSPYPSYFPSGYQPGILPLLHWVTKSFSRLCLRSDSYEFLRLEQTFGYICRFQHDSLVRIR